MLQFPQASADTCNDRKLSFVRVSVVLQGGRKRGGWGGGGLTGTVYE